MNIATVIGIISGLGILSFATYMSTDSIMAFVNFPGFSIVLGGTIAATFICYPLKEVLLVFKVFIAALQREELPTGNYIAELVFLAKKASAKGKIHLEKELSGIENYFLQDGLQMLVDGYGKEEIREIMDVRIQNTCEQEMATAGIVRTMARLAPAFGIIGTLIGLISMMQAMGGDIESIGPGMATALTTTLYGILLANMIFLPIAVKVENRINERVILMSVIRDGILYIREKTPAAIVLHKLKSYLPPRRWSSIKGRALARPALKPAAAQARR